MSSPAPTSIWTRTLVYLGLWEEGDGYEQPVADAPVTEPEPDRSGRPAAAPQHGNVRPLRLASSGGSPRTEVVVVTSFDDCEAIARVYRDGGAVLFDLAQVDRTTARRVIDFVSGSTYVLRGRLTRVASRAFLLVPDGVAVGEAERARLEAQGYRLADGA